MTVTFVDNQALLLEYVLRTYKARLDFQYDEARTSGSSNLVGLEKEKQCVAALIEHCSLAREYDLDVDQVYSQVPYPEFLVDRVEF